jgi:IS30 family transposase
VGKKLGKSARSKKAKTVKKKLKGRKAKSSKLKNKKTKTKKKVKKKKKKKRANSSVISDLSSIVENNIQEKISNLKIQDQQLKNLPLEAQKSFNFVYQSKPIARNSESYKHPPNPFQSKPMKLPINKGQFVKNNIFGNNKINILRNGSNGKFKTLRGIN